MNRSKLYSASLIRASQCFDRFRLPGRFLVLPKAYTISRFEPEDERAYRPAIYLYSNVDAVHPERTTCILMATLRPAIAPAARQALVDALRTAVHPKPILEWPTELPIDARCTWAIPGASGAFQIVPTAVKTSEGFQVSFTAGVDQILQLKAMVEKSGIVASVVFPFADGTTLQSTLVVDLGHIDGPWDAGAVSVTVADDRATLVNRVERAADIAEVLTYAGQARMGAVAVERRLEPGASLDIGVPAGTDAVVPRYMLANAATSLEEVRTFIEDVFTNVVFVCTFDLATERIDRISIDGRIVGAVGDATALIAASANVASAEMDFVLPLTTYLAQPMLQYRTTTVGSDGAARSGGWRDWRLDVRGNVVEIGKEDLKEA
jgi:hypothetical protein